jgi:signal transduction histidine kinase/ligand-binding sensor domain-containing protein
MPLRRTSGGFRIALTIAVLLTPAPSASGQRLPERSFGVADGLLSDTAMCLLLDSRGFLWVGTRTGVSRFDGAKFVSYDLPGTMVNSIMEDRDGRIWVATNGGGAARLDPTASRRVFELFPVGTTRTTNRVNTLVQDARHRIWAATDGGLFRAESAAQPRFEVVPLAGSAEGPAAGLPRLARGRDDVLWLGSYRGLEALLPDGTLISYVGTEQRGQRAVQGLLLDDRGLLWVATDIGVFVFRPHDAGAERARRPAALFLSDPCRQDHSLQWTLPEEAGSACQLPLPPGAASHDVRALIATHDGRVVIATIAGQIAEFNRGNLQWIVRSTDRAGLMGAIEDRMGHLWIAGDSAGIRRLARVGMIPYDLSSGLGASRLVAILGERAGGLLLAGSDNAIYRFDRGRLSRVPLMLPPRVVPPTWFGHMIDRRGTVWLSTGEGLFRFAFPDDVVRTVSPTLYTTRDGLPSNNVGMLFEDSRGDIWISAGSGSDAALARWEAATGKIHSYPARVDGGRFSQVIAFAEDRTGMLWVSFRDGGLARIRGMRMEAVESLNELLVASLYVDPAGRLWTGSFSGALRFDALDVPRPTPVRYTTQNGLSSDVVRLFTADRLGRVYIATAAGVDRLDTSTGAVRHFGSAEGIPGGEVRDAFAAADGTLWFATTSGIASLTPAAEPPGARPRVWIENVNVAGVPQPLAALGTASASGFRFGPSLNRVQFDFFGISPDLIEPLRYEYRLEGLEPGWTGPSRERSIAYASLAPGSYRFTVRALTAAGVASEASASIAFEILRPIWLRWWVIALAAAAAACIVYGAHRYRLSHALRLERVRHRIATDLHDDIGASLSQIAILSDLGRNRLDTRDIDRASEALVTIATTARELIDTMSDIVWAVNPQRDSVDDLVHRMRRFAADSLEAVQVSLAFRAPAEGATMPLGPNLRRELLLILKESVTNIVRHASCTEAEIEFRADRHHLVLHISDNGRGFDTATAGAGNGLRSLRRRVDALGGAMHIDSVPGSGTRIAVTITLSSAGLRT